MPLLSQFLLPVIITLILTTDTCRIWHWMPLPIPSLVTLHKWFISDWNKGVYLNPNRFRYKTKLSLVPHVLPLTGQRSIDSLDNLHVPRVIPIIRVYLMPITWNWLMCARNTLVVSQKIGICRLTYTALPLPTTTIKCILAQIQKIYALILGPQLVLLGLRQTSSTCILSQTLQ